MAGRLGNANDMICWRVSWLLLYTRRFVLNAGMFDLYMIVAWLWDWPVSVCGMSSTVVAAWGRRLSTYCLLSTTCPIIA